MSARAPTRHALPEHVLADLAAGRGRSFQRELMSMTFMLVLATFAIVPLLGVTVMMAHELSTIEQDVPSKMVVAAVGAACLFFVAVIVRRIRHHRDRLQAVARGEDKIGFHVTPSGFYALVDAFPHVDLVEVPCEAIIHIQHTLNHFYSENVSREYELVTLHTTDPERPYVVLSHTLAGTTLRELTDALNDVLDVPWSDEVVRLDDDYREDHAIYLS